MTKDTPESSGGAFHTVHAERDLQSNWEVDLAKKLEEYLLKICSGEIIGEDEGSIHVNFAEAALLLQGSIQVYSRKVEYLYNLVLRTLEFLSHKRQADQVDGEPVQPEDAGPSAVAADEENDHFWGFDDIPVDEKNSLDSSTGKDVNLDQFIKPPANLVVLEGDCLDTGGDGGELESYLLSTTDLYQDFILLDTSDAVAVHEFMKSQNAGTTHCGTNRATSIRKSFLSPRRSGGSAHKSVAKSQRANSMFSPKKFSFEDKDARPSSPASAGFDNSNFGPNMDDGFDAPMDADNSDADDDDDDPWIPLNPHEPGNLRVKPFRKVKASKKVRINVRPRVSMTTLFPLAKLHGPISPELTKMWEMRRCAHQRQKDSQSSPPLYEKLRQSLINGENETDEPFLNTEDDNVNEFDNGNPDFDMPGNDFMDEDPHPFNNEHEVDDVHAHADADEAVDLEFPDSQTSLEDLCRSHLNALLASIAETEKQTEMAARISTWKQRIEHNLEEQESHPPFDIRDYGERILGKLSLEESSSSVMPFSNLVVGQVKYDVSRSFSSLLQLVNNGEVDLQRHDVAGESFCYTSVNPFHVKLLKHHKTKEVTKQFGIAKKRAKSPIKKPSPNGEKKTRREKSPTKRPSPKDEKKKTRREKSPISSSSRNHRSTWLSSPTNTRSSSQKHGPTGLSSTTITSSSSRKHGPTGLTSPTINNSSSRKHGPTGLASPTNCKFSVNLGKESTMKFSPASKRRRRSPFIESVN
ncbi:condensin-2 complex subunit H2-like [Trifolium pratense]|uniref:condensin-2 complex subunit H2-like n=1 Tax=Trifolium pratense TaxID=57577 RepID=UPI001E694803|nr:condensin-2 complex subunit H2-like [Trifolium pratense]